MADNTQTYTTRIFLNTEEAKKRLEELQGKVEEFRKKKEAAARAGDWPTFNSLKKQLDMTNNEMRAMQTSAQKIDRVLGNLSVAGIKDIQQTITAINKELSSGTIERGSEEWKFLNEQLTRCKAELRDIRGESAITGSLWQRFTGFLNKNWGAITQIISGISGLTMTVRKSVQSFADMEEEMADVRKFTGLADEKVRDLNEDLKKMDTRTGRDQLNQLAGSAGRLGKQAKKDVLDFVEGADMINVALGEDLGDGAVEKIGKLSMAFGEDKKKGLKGAMLSTGSAINELVQNSSAQAGFLVDFTARVAGFGKQLGLTQAQIMGFGTVMDENLLRDEMAATAFGNMLTKMQTDTEKFAKIAGMNVKEFTDLLNKDANAAVLALADSLKRADPQTMMKMLDSMGLDGSRAVGVLSTLADKIDDVRKHQERAKEAYEKGTSVLDEFNIKNNTVQARLDKCRKSFKEMSVELGERLLPVVQYTITGASMLAKTLSVLTKFVYDHWKGIAVLTGYVAALTVVWNAHTIAMKASNVVESISIALKKGHAFIVNTLKQAYVAWRIVIAAVTANHVRLNSAMVDMKRLQMTNVWTALITVVLTAAVAIYGAVTAWQKHREAVRSNLQEVKNMRAQQQLSKDMNKMVSESIAEQKTKVEQLSRVIHSNAYTIDERRSAIKTLQSIIPDYHAAISKEGELYNDNSTAIKQYIQDLSDAALAEALYQKKVEINRKKMELGFKENRIKGSLKAVQAYRDANPDAMKPKQKAIAGAYSTSIEVQSDAMTESMRQQQIHEQRLEDVKSEQKVVEAEDKYIDDVLKKNEKANRLFNSKLTKTTTPINNPPGNNPPRPYKSDDELKKEEEERRRLEEEEKKRRKEAEDAAKAESDAKIATLTHQYAMGEIAYRQYIQKLADLQTEGLKKRRDAYEKGSAEYERLNRQVEERAFKGDQQVNRMKLDDLRHSMQLQQAEIEAQAVRGEITESKKLEELQELEEKYLADVVKQYKAGSLERMKAEWELQEVEKRNKLERERHYQQQVEQIREQYFGMSNDRQMEIAMKGLDELHTKGLLKEKDYQAAKAALQAQYASYQTTSERNQQVGSDMLRVAGDAAKKELDGKPGSDTPFLNDIMQYQTTMEKLKQLYGNDKENHDAYLAAKQQATAQFCANIASQMQAAYNSINQVMSAASSYFSAQQEYETAQVQKKYEKQIEAAGNNQKKVKKLQEQQQKEEAAIKTKYNKKQMTIQMAQAVAQTAVNAISAYGAALQIGPLGLTLAPIAAAMAIAAGMIQIAALKKQQEAQAAGYYEGGFTGGHRYRKEAGVVHEGEFVANHQAVQNPNILPFLNFLDQAQRNNTIGSLTMQDVSRSMGAGGSSQVITPIVNYQSDNAELRQAVDANREATEMLIDRLNDPIEARMSMQEFDRDYKKYQKLLKSK
jgi:TP901 family phage tail tape measure protein